MAQEREVLSIKAYFGMEGKYRQSLAKVFVKAVVNKGL